MITPELLNKIKTKLKTNRATYEYFFNSINDPAWILPLIEAGFFKSPDEPIREGDYISFPNWPEIGFLLRMADKDEDNVIAALELVPPTENQRVMDDFVQILLKISSKKAVRFIPNVLRFLESRYQLRLHDFCCDLVLKLAKDGFIKPSIQIAKSLLEIQENPKVKELKKDELRMSLLDPLIKYREYEYQEIIEKIVPVLAEAAPVDTIHLFAALLEKFVDLKLFRTAAVKDETPQEDYSYIWRPNIGDTHHNQDQPRQGLITALRDSLLELLKSDLTESEKLALLKKITARKYKIFGRITEYVLRDYQNKKEFAFFYKALRKTVSPVTDESQLHSILDRSSSRNTTLFEHLSEMTDKELVDEIAVYTPDPTEHFLRSESMPDTVTAVIKSDIKRYVKLSSEFSDLKPEYIHSFLSAVNEKIDDLDENDISEALSLGQALLKSKDIEKGQYYDWSKMALVRLLEKIAGQKENKSECISLKTANLALEMLLQLSRDSDPTPEHEEKYGGDNMDPATLSLNSTRGVAIHALIRFALWAKRNKTGAGFIESIYNEFEWHLDPTNDPSLAVRSVFGQELPWVWIPNKQWIEKNIDHIFTDDERGDSAWNAYISFNQAYSDILPILEHVFKKKIKKLTVPSKDSKELKEYQARIADHLMIYYWNGYLFLEKNGLLDLFFKTAPVKYRSEAINYIGFELRRIEVQPEKDILDRLKKLWESRLKDVLTNPNQGTEELEEFGSWFSSGAFEIEWAIDNLQKVLQVTHLASPDFMVLEKLSEIAEEFPLKTIQCLKELIIGARERWSITSWRDEAFKIIEVAYNSNDSAARKLAEEQANLLVAKGYHNFRDAIRK